MIVAGPVVGAVTAAGAIAAESTSAGFDPWSLLTTGGPVGILVAVFYLLLTGKLHTHGEVTRLESSVEAERVARIALQTTLTTEVVPALTRSADAVTRSNGLMEAMAQRQAGGG